MRGLAAVAAAVAVAGVVCGCGGDDGPAAAVPAAPGTAVSSSAGGAAFPSARDARPATLWAVGDGAADGDEPGRVAGRIRASRADRVLYLGDVYDAGTAEEFARFYAPTYGRVANRTAPTPGNHEWPNHRTGYDPYWRRVTGVRTPPWYAFSLGGWRLLSLNSEAPHDAGSPQLRWLRRELRGRTTCRLAFWHRPRYSAGKHGDQEDVAPLWDAVRGRAALVLNGHDHDMQRLRPRDGIAQYVTGAGGKSHYGVDEGDDRLAFANDTADGALHLRLAPGRARLEFVTADGRVLDTSRVRCRR
jgi:hypothetical protein